MAQNGGVIVNIIADMFRGFPVMAHTGAARAAVENLTKVCLVKMRQVWDYLLSAINVKEFKVNLAILVHFENNRQNLGTNLLLKTILIYTVFK